MKSKKKTSLGSDSVPVTPVPAPAAPIAPPQNQPVSAKLQEPLEVPNTVPSAAMQSHGQSLADVPSGSLQSATPLKDVPSATLQAPVHHEEIEHGVLPIPPAKKLSKLPSFKDLAKKVETAGQQTNAVNEADKPEEVYKGAIIPVNKEKLQQAWDEFARRKRQENMSEFMILNRSFEINDKNEILLFVENPVQVDQFNAFKPDLLGELRNKLDNRSISVKIEMKTEQEGLRLYTSIDKFNYLSSLYPTLAELKTRLGLDTDF